MNSKKLARATAPASEKLFQRLAASAGAKCLSLCWVIGVSGFLAATLPFAHSPAYADDADTQQGIAAVVNDKLVSRYDLDQRVKLIMVTSGIPDTPENRSRIQPQVLRSLVDESLEMQEAKRLEIKVDAKEVKEQLDGIAKRANMTSQQIDDFLSKNKVSKDSLIGQISAEIAWNKVIGQQFGPLITVSEEEITDIQNRLKAESNEPRYLISEILLTYDTAAQEEEMMGGASRLADQIRSGAPFAAVAQQFSRSASAANGGDIGWVHLSQLPTEVSAIVAQMGIGAVSEPIKTLNGIYLIQLRNKQTGEGSDPMQDQWTLVRILLPLTPDAPDTAVRQRAGEAGKIVSEFKSCDAISGLIKPYTGAVADTPRTVVFGSLDAHLKALISKSKPGEMLPPSRSKEGVELLAVCDHKVNDPQMPTRDSIEDNLYSQQLSMMSRRHLRDLRRDAVIEMR